MKNISFTGHRVIGITPELRAALQEAVENFIAKGAVNFYAGGAIGFDTLCAETVLGLRQKYPQIRLCLLLPCPPDEQTVRWRTDQKEKYREILSQADETEICSEKYFNGCMKKETPVLLKGRTLLYAAAETLQAVQDKPLKWRAERVSRS